MRRLTWLRTPEERRGEPKPVLNRAFPMPLRVVWRTRRGVYEATNQSFPLDRNAFVTGVGFGPEHRAAHPRNPGDADQRQRLSNQ